MIDFSSPTVHRWLLWVTAAMTAFFGPLDISADGAAMTVGLDPIVGMKLTVAGIAVCLGIHGTITSPVVRDALQSIPAMLVLCILLLVAAAGPTAISSASIPSTIINLGYLLFAVTALVGLGISGITTAVLLGLTISATLAWILFFAAPTYGVFPELLADGLIVKRLGGVAHPNSVSRTVMLGMLLTMYQYRSNRFSTIPSIVLGILFVSAGWFAWSRTGLLAGIIAAGVLWLDRLRGPRTVALVTLGGIAILAAITLLFAIGKEDKMVDRVISKFAKSGNAEEIKSGTGRSEIWSYAIELIQKRPVIGHGFNAAPILMKNHSQSTHNAVLHASLSGGIIAGGLMLTLLIWNFATGVLHANMLIRAVVTFLIISCLMEETVFETFPGPCTLLWLVCTFYPAMVPRKASSDVGVNFNGSANHHPSPGDSLAAGDA